MRKIVLLLLLCSCIAFSQEKQEKHQKAKISFNSLYDINTLHSIGMPVDHGQHQPGDYYISIFSVSEIDIIKNAGFSVEILIEDAKEHYLQQNQNRSRQEENLACTSSEDYLTPDNFQLGSMGGYFTYQEVLDQLDLMRSLYPNLITEKENIGNFLTEGTPDNSTTPPIGGNGIKWVKISDNPEDSSEGEAQILYTAIHHAREPTSLSQLIFYMWYVLENYETNAEIKNIVDNTELYFVPVVNPDGYLYNEKTDPNGGGFWRKNRKNTHGVDNNRNYQYFINGDPNQGIWGGEGTSTDPDSNIYHGEAPFSEVENQAIKWFCEQHNFKMALNNHSFGDLLLFPFGYTSNMPTPDNDLYLGISEEMVSKNNYANIIASDLYPAAGTSDDFMYGTVGTHEKIIAFIPEIGNSFWLPIDQIIPTCKEMMYLNITAAKMTNSSSHFSDNSPYFVGQSSVINFDFSLKYLGLETEDQLNIQFLPISSNIDFDGDPILLTDVETLEENDLAFQYIINPGTIPGDVMKFELQIDNGDYQYSIPVSKKFGAFQTVFEDAGYSVFDNFETDGWDISTEEYVSPSSSFTESPEGNYGNNELKTITTLNEIDLSTAIHADVTFYAKWSIHINWDYVQFEISTDGGNTWIPQCGNYTELGSNLGFQPEGEPLYQGSQSSWVQESINLNDYLGESILMRFQFASNEFGTQDGFYFDDIAVQIVDEELLSTNNFQEIPLTVYPNPVQDQLIITTPLEEYSITIYNLQGQILGSYQAISGTQTINYSQYPNGIYLMTISSQEQTKTMKIIKQ